MTAQERAIRLVFNDAIRTGKPFKNPNNIIYRGPRRPWYKSRLRNKETGQIAPFQGLGLSRQEAAVDLRKQIRRAGWGDRLFGHQVAVDEATGRKVSVTTKLYELDSAPMDTVLPERLAKKYPGYGGSWHSAKRWGNQDQIIRKRRRRR